MFTNLNWKNSARPLEATCWLLIFYGSNTLAMNYLPFSPLLASWSWPYATDIVLTFVDLVSLGGLLWILKIRGMGLSNSQPASDLKQKVLYSLLTFLVIYASDKLYSHFFPIPPLETQGWGSFLAQFSLAVISGPIFEEVLFRGLLLRYVFPKQPIFGLIVSSFVFVLIHPISDLSAFWFYGLPGLALGMLYGKTKDIRLPIAVHMALNLLSHVQIHFF
ncbi:CPBP family intramembrane glutamic endopeptidase [Streptococcus sp. NLN76]|uniref:CPBP family intramembrane glutamic endopeptidase n=1 Tax=Streptococcus sp. NLN76 TaxID=2822800 RepID=UPI0018AC3BA9|nr:CPBP family intramembrane glutamic endopeptidase [Streptococcus sp. NLN76]MBF8969610.1 CPBP family intramembrane metalloprotease [Streptococcus sp. NLN76]